MGSLTELAKLVANMTRFAMSGHTVQSGAERDEVARYQNNVKSYALCRLIRNTTWPVPYSLWLPASWAVEKLGRVMELGTPGTRLPSTR